MTCGRCLETKDHRRTHTFKRTIAGTTFLADVEVDACSGCDEVVVPAALVVAFDRAIASELARSGPAKGETFRFIRKAIPLSTVDVARMLDMPLETVNRWEAGLRSVDLASWMMLASIALESFDAPAPILPRLSAVRTPSSGPRMLEITPLGVDGAALRARLDAHAELDLDADLPLPRASRDAGRSAREG